MAAFSREKIEGGAERTCDRRVRNPVVPICQPRSALENPVLVPPSTGFFCEYQFSRNRESSVRPLFAPVAGELMPGQGQLDETLPVRTFGRHGALHRRLGFMLWIVLGTHEANSSRTIWTSAWQFRPYDCGVNAVPADLRRDLTRASVGPPATIVGLRRTDL